MPGEKIPKKKLKKGGGSGGRSSGGSQIVNPAKRKIRHPSRRKRS